ncbi:hypothetical protein GTZ85_42220 [Streptomyces sp. SID5474]|nr:hypothetical protein [Streptomyces sp. SID5474]
MRAREGAWVAEVTDTVDLTGWPRGVRVIVCKERPYPGAQLWITDVDGNRCVCFVTNTAGGQLADLELRHRRRARAEDRIRRAPRPACGSCPCAASRRTGCGANSSPLSASWSRGRRCSPRPAKRGDGRSGSSASASSEPPLVRTGRRTIVRAAERWPWLTRSRMIGHPERVLRHPSGHSGRRLIDL